MLDWIFDVNWPNYVKGYIILWCLAFAAYPFVKLWYWVFPSKPDDELDDESDD